MTRRSDQPAEAPDGRFAVIYCPPSREPVPTAGAQAVPVRARHARNPLWRDFLDATGSLHIDDTSVTCALNLRSHHPVLIDAGFADLKTPIPWWDRRTLQFRFPP